MTYTEWLEHTISEYQPEWICDELTEIGDYCEKNCNSDWNSECLERYYKLVIQAEATLEIEESEETE